jgi:radical SAM protein with 4Fe4S-binding SPASM domain
MDELIAFVNGLESIRTHSVSLIRGDVSDENMKNVDTNKYLQTVKKIESNLKKRRSSIYSFRGAKLKAAQDILQRRLIHDTLLKQKRLIPCYAGRLNLVLTETGNLYPCESFNMKLGNVKENDYDIKKVLQSRKAQKVTDSIKKKGCYCTHECYFMTNILFNPLMYPALLKEYLQI